MESFSSVEAPHVSNAVLSWLVMLDTASDGGWARSRVPSLSLQPLRIRNRAMYLILQLCLETFFHSQFLPSEDVQAEGRRYVQHV